MKNISAKNVLPISGFIFTTEKTEKNTVTSSSEAGGRENGENFFCSACLQDLPVREQSEDKRYCEICFHFLTREAEQTRSSAAWIPVKQTVTLGDDKESIGGNGVTADIKGQVKALSGQGLSTRAIARQLGGISHMTVARVLKNE